MKALRTGLQYLYFCRFPLLVALLLLGLAPLAVWGAPSLLGGLFFLDGIGILLVVWVALFTAWVVLITLELVVRSAPERFDVRALAVPGWLHRFRVPLFALLALPIAAAAVWLSPGSLAARLGWAAVGALLAGIGLLLAGAAHALLRARGTAPSEAVPGAWLFGWLPSFGRGTRGTRAAGGPGPGYGSPRHAGLATAHRVAALLFIVTLAVYFALFFADRPGGGGPPALAYVLLLVLLFAWGLPGVSFWLDRYRVPVLLVLVAASFLSSKACDTDHYYRIVPEPRQPRLAEPVAPEAAYESAEAADTGPERPIVVVAASGGGITAAVWTARVLTALQAEVGDDFARSIRLVSSVSGGSVGTMYYLDRFGPQGPPSPQARADLVRNAGKSSLDAVGWGIVYPDLWRTLGGFLLVDETEDRGWALERTWRERLAHGDGMLSGWREGVRAGWLPPAVLNATTVETGERFLLTPLGELATAPGLGLRFDTVYPGYDLPVVTAARLSATFSWVSPLTRASLRDDEPANPSYHLGDGGYYDNFGVVTVVEWLRALQDDYGEELKRRGVILIMIRAFPGGDPAPPNPSESRGWLYGSLGPVITLLAVRSSSQSFRNDLDVDLLGEAWECEGIPLHPVPFVLQEKSPLSWKLTPEEFRAIVDGWSEKTNQDSLRKVRALFEQTAPPPPAAGSGPGG